MDDFVAELRTKGLLSEASARRLDELETRAHVPLARELHALLYSGAVLILAGVGAAVKDRLDQLGPMTILAALAAGSLACLGYCFHTARPYRPERVEPPHMAFDYILYLGAGLAGIFMTYLEWKFHALGDWWDLYLFFAGLVCLGLAYRFDNILALNTGLLNLAGWLGVRLNRWGMPPLGMRTSAFALGSAAIALAEGSRRSGVKPHFEDVYLRFGVHLCLLSLIWGAAGLDSPDFWILLAACAVLGAKAAARRKFEIFAAAVVYAYAGIMHVALPLIGHGDSVLWANVIAPGVVLGLLLWARRKFREDA